jgi:hypothetical protein
MACSCEPGRIFVLSFVTLFYLSDIDHITALDAASDPGIIRTIDIRQDLKYDIPGIGTIDVGTASMFFSIESCSKSAHVNMTLNDQVIFPDTHVDDITANPMCANVPNVQYPVCVKLREAEITPAYTNLCPTVFLKADIPFLPNPSDDLDCATVGAKCVGTTWDVCTQNEACGWCEASQECIARNPDTDHAYCSSCTPLESWCADADDCSEKYDPDESGLSKGATIGMAVSGGVLLIGLVGIGAMIKKRRASEASRSSNHTRSYSSDDDDTGVTVGSGEVQMYSPLDE